MNETWKDIPSASGYKASNLGRIMGKKGGVMRPSVSRTGYEGVPICGDGKQKTRTVHRLVAETFLGYSDLTVDHIDGNKTNNAISNLRYLPNRENCTAYQNRIGKEMTGAYKRVRNGKIFWQAQVSVNDKDIHIGVYDTQHEAHLAYKKYLGATP